MDRVQLPGVSEMGAMDRRYDVRIAERIEEIQVRIAALEARIEALEP
jgi:hypothetical protein